MPKNIPSVPTAKKNSPRTPGKKRRPQVFDKDLSATFGMLDAVKSELKMDIRSLEKRMDARFTSMDSRFLSIDARFFAMDGSIADLSLAIQSMKLMLESQHAKNNVVLDHLSTLFTRQERVEQSLQKAEEFFFKQIK